MKTAYVIAGIGCILILAAGLMAGCAGTTGTSPAAGTGAAAPTNPTGSIPAVTTPSTLSPEGTTVPSTPGTAVRTLYLNSTYNGRIVTVPVGDRVLIRLAENPTTGYSWNATGSKGLTIVSDKYTAPGTGLMGAAGYHDWILSPQTVDTYTFKAVSLRPWEGASSAADTFAVVIQATKK
jgi:inhibitor of cysteine peptidase